MSEYIVTARKWRPMKFEDVAGQDHVTRTLRNALASSRLAHAYLFSGPRGVGKTTTARLLAKAVNCLNPQDANPDNTCEHCLEITEGRSFDVQEIDGASNRGVEEIRNLREAVRYPPVKCAYKVYIIDEVHMLTKEAFNALLKTLEEPPSHILFIFATTELSKVPATILSRCQRFDFRRISHAKIMENLKTIAGVEGIAVDDDALSLIARRGDGSLRDAQSLFDQVIALCGNAVTLAGMEEALNIVGTDVYFRVTELMERQDAQGGLMLVDDLMSGGYDLREFLSGLMEHFRNLLVARVVGATELIEASDVYRARYGETAAKFSVSDLLRAQRLIHGTDQALRYTAQPRFRLEADLVQLVTMPRAVDLAGLIEGIEELKKKGSPEVARTFTTPARSVSASSTGPVQVTTHNRTPSSLPGTGSQQTSAGTPQSRVAGEDEVRSRWAEYVAEVSRLKISVGVVLGATTLLGVSQGVVRLGCVDEFQASTVQRNREVLMEIFARVFNARGVIQPEVQETGGEAGGGTAKTPSAEEHPVVQALRRELGAEPL
ncbi:MAG: DNA polymerase III subunit gamma/tau [Bacteroidetes bacterium]|nr:DNA polymerase III subunit gamma/tau [Bacteroidota bacterium]